MEEDALDSKPPLTTEEDEPKHTVLHGSHITETQQVGLKYELVGLDPMSR